MLTQKIAIAASIINFFIMDKFKFLVDNSLLIDKRQTSRLQKYNVFDFLKPFPYINNLNFCYFCRLSAQQMREIAQNPL